MPNALEIFMARARGVPLPEATETKPPKTKPPPQHPPAPKLLTGPMAAYFTPLPLVVSAVERREKEGAARPEQSVARYGRIYKRKAVSRLGFGFLPCPPGHRYCTECKATLPLDKFYSRHTRYICRRHHYQRVNRRFNERMKESVYERVAEDCWIGLYEMCPIIGRTKVEYDRHDIKDIIRLTKVPLDITPRAVPLDPTMPMRPRNVGIISKQNVKALLNLYMTTNSRAQYILFVRSCNLVPPNADVGTPWDPFHDPEYKAPEIDVVSILLHEMSLPLERPHVEAAQLTEEQAKEVWGKKAPPPRIAPSDDIAAAAHVMQS